MKFPIALEEIHNLSQCIRMLYSIKTILTIIDKIPWYGQVFHLSDCWAIKKLSIWKPLPALIFFPGFWGLWSGEVSCCKVGPSLSGQSGKGPVRKQSVSIDKQFQILLFDLLWQGRKTWMVSSGERAAIAFLDVYVCSRMSPEKVLWFPW